MNMDKYFMWIHYERLHNHNKAKHNKTVCIFLGIYCSIFFHRFRTRSIRWGKVTHICVSELTIIDSDNGLSPGWHQAVIWANAGRLLIEPLGTNFSEILIEIYTFSFKNMYLKMSSAKWWRFCLGLNVLPRRISQASLVSVSLHLLGRLLIPLHWRHNDHDGVSNHQPYGCLLNRLFRSRSKKTSKFRVTGLYAGSSLGPVNSPHKGQ